MGRHVVTSLDQNDHIWSFARTDIRIRPKRRAINFSAETMKRKGNGGLTGGTGDVSPQYYSFQLTMTAANTYRETPIATPVPRNKQTGDQVTVMEILKVFFDGGEADANPAAAGSVISLAAQLSTKSLTALDSNSPNVFAFFSKQIRGAFTAAGSYGMSYYEPYCFDMTDGAGHGVLIATDNIYFGLNTANFTAVSFCNARLLYRMKNVSLAEYIGIVQSQQ